MLWLCFKTPRIKQKVVTTSTLMLSSVLFKLQLHLYRHVAINGSIFIIAAIIVATCQERINIASVCWLCSHNQPLEAIN